MQIDWIHFTPWPALLGGALIGLAAALLILLNGRIAGICGIVGGILRPHSGDVSWRIAFVTGVIVSPLIWQAFTTLPTIQVDADFGVLVAAGLLVGLGTRYGSGCTSGHGINGSIQLSLASMVTAACFFAGGIITALLFFRVVGVW